MERPEPGAWISTKPSASPASSSPKLDGTSKGGMVVAIQRELGLPIKYIGVGEKPTTSSPSTRSSLRRRCLRNN